MNKSKKEFQKNQAKIIACISLIIDTVDSSTVVPDSQFQEFYDKAKELSEIGLPILDKIYGQKELSASTFVNDMAEKVDWQFNKLYKL